MESSGHQPKQDTVLFAGLLVLIQALPWLPLLIHRFSPVAFATESVGYRYFHSYRLIHHDGSTIWEAQGQTLGVLHEFFQKLLDWLEIAALRDRIDLFSYGTLAFNTLMFGAVAWCFNRALPAGWRLRLLFAAAALFGIYGSSWGLFSARLPDYYTYEVTLTVSCLGLFIFWLQQPNPRMSPTRAVALGILAGAMIGIKITLLPAALLPLLPYLMRTEGSWRQLLLWVSLWIAAAAAMVAAVIATYYHFDFGHLAQAFQAWRSFVVAPGAEPGFISSLLHPFAAGNNPWADHRFIPVVFILWLAALVAATHAFIKEPTRRREHLVLGFYVLSCSALHIWAVFKRPAETTLFETSLFLVATAAALLASLPARPPYQKVTTLWLSLVLSWCLLSSLKHFPSASTIAWMEETSRNAWEMHDWLNATGRPVVVLLPDNRYVSGTVEEALLKGFSDVPTWNITSGYALLDAVAPRRRFVTQLSAAPAGSVLVWTDVPGIPALADLTRTPPAVLGQIPLEVRSWSMRNKYRPRTVHAAVFGTADGARDETVLTASADWRDANPANLLADFSISPAEAAPRIELRTEAGRQVVRITATQPTPYLALGGTIPPLPHRAGLLRMQSTLRVSTARPVLWQLHSVADASGTNAAVVESIAVRPRAWTTWAIRKSVTDQASPGDNFSVGLASVQPGDWFEIAELSVQLEEGGPMK